MLSATCLLHHCNCCSEANIGHNWNRPEKWGGDLIESASINVILHQQKYVSRFKCVCAIGMHWFNEHECLRNIQFLDKNKNKDEIIQNTLHQWMNEKTYLCVQYNTYIHTFHLYLYIYHHEYIYLYICMCCITIIFMVHNICMFFFCWLSFCLVCQIFHIVLFCFVCVQIMIDTCWMLNELYIYMCKCVYIMTLNQCVIHRHTYADWFRCIYRTEWPHIVWPKVAMKEMWSALLMCLFVCSSQANSRIDFNTWLYASNKQCAIYCGLDIWKIDWKTKKR